MNKSSHLPVSQEQSRDPCCTVWTTTIGLHLYCQHISEEMFDKTLYVVFYSEINKYSTLKSPQCLSKKKIHGDASASNTDRNYKHTQRIKMYSFKSMWASLQGKTETYHVYLWRLSLAQMKLMTSLCFLCSPLVMGCWTKTQGKKQRSNLRSWEWKKENGERHIYLAMWDSFEQKNTMSWKNRKYNCGTLITSEVASIMYEAVTSSSEANPRVPQCFIPLNISLPSYKETFSEQVRK